MMLRAMESRTSSHKPQVGHCLTRLPTDLKAVDQPLPDPHTNFKSYPELTFCIQRKHYERSHIWYPKAMLGLLQRLWQLPLSHTVYT